MHEASLFYGAFNRGFALWAKDFVRTYRAILWRVLDYSRDIKKRCTRHLFFMAPSIGALPFGQKTSSEPTALYFGGFLTIQGT